MSLARREVLTGVAAGLIAVRGAGTIRWLTPAAAAAEAASLTSFTPAEAALLGGFASVLVLDAAAKGVVHYVDHHISIPPAQSLLTLRYLGVPPPYGTFYRQGLGALAKLVRAQGAQEWSALDEATARAIVDRVRTNAVADWDGPPAPLFYFAVRSDAVDVVYGTEAGFAALGVEYLPHIPPRPAW